MKTEYVCRDCDTLEILGVYDPDDGYVPISDYLACFSNFIGRELDDEDRRLIDEILRELSPLPDAYFAL